MKKLNSSLTAPRYKALCKTILQTDNTESAGIDEEDMYEKINRLIKEGQEITALAKEQDLILFLGCTGCGKSTVINYLSGCTMVFCEDPNTGEIYIDCENPVTEIGHTAVSTTLYPFVVAQLKEYQNLMYKFCDTAGFSDNRGVEYDICAAFSLGMVFNQSKSISIVVIIEEAAVYEARSKKLNETFFYVNECFNASNCKNSILFIINKISNKTKTHIYNKINSLYTDMKNNKINNPETDWLYEKILEDNGKNIHICKDFNEQERKQLIAPIEKLGKVTDKEKAFKYPISSDTKLKLITIINNLAESLSKAAANLFQRYYNNLDNILQKEKIMIAAKIIMDDLSGLEHYKGKDITFDELLIIFERLLKEKDDKMYLKEIKSEFEKFNIMKHYGASDHDPLNISKAEIDNFINKINTKISEKKQNTYHTNIQFLQEIFASYDIQKRMNEVQAAFNKTEDHKYTAKDFEPILSFISSEQEKDTAGRYIKELIDLDIFNNEIKSFINQYILKPFIIPDTAEKIEERNSLIIRANIKNMVISAVIAALSTKKIEYDDIWLIAQNSMYLDSNMDSSAFREKNLVISCKDIVLKKSVCINVSGYDLVSEYTGLHGKDGGNGGNIHLQITGEIDHTFDKKAYLELKANGGNGSDGKNGMVGAPGSAGANGEDGEFARPDTNNFERLVKGSEGQPGEKGMTGGDAGQGGYGGIPGKLKLFAMDPSKCESVIKLSNVPGKDGKKGTPGAGGTGGKGGYDGYNVFTHKYISFWKVRYLKGYFVRVHVHNRGGGFDYDVGTDDKTGEKYPYTMGYDETDFDGPGRNYKPDGENGDSGKNISNSHNKAPAIPCIAEKTITDNR